MAAAILIAILGADRAAAEIVASPTTIGVPAPGEQRATVSVDLLHDDGLALSGLSVSVVSIEGPKGPMDIGAEPAAVAPPTDQQLQALTPNPRAKVPLELQVTRAAFAAPGVYTIVLRVSGAAGPLPDPEPFHNEDITLTLDRQPAVIEVSWPANRLVVLERGWPWQTASGERRIQVDVRSGDLDRVQVVATEPVHATTEAGEGRIADAPLAIDVSSGSGTGTIEFTNFGHAGEFTAVLKFMDLRLAESLAVPIKIRVRDSLWLPLIVIAAGVLISAGANFAVRQWRVRRLSMLRIAQLLVTLEMLDVAITRPRTRNQFDTLRSRLENLNETVDLIAEPETELAAIEGEIDKLAKEIATLEESLRTEIPAQREAVAKAGRVLKDAPDSDRRLDTSSDLVDQAKALLDAGQIEASAMRLELARQDLDRAKRDLAVQALDAIEDMIDRITDPAQKQTYATALAGARADLKNGADALLVVEGLRKVVVPARISALSAAAQPAAASISIDPEAKLRVTGTILTFRITPATGKHVETIRWRLGSQVLDPTSETSVNSSFNTPGHYEASAAISYKDGSKEAVALPFRVLASPARQRVARLANSIRWVDVGLVVIAAVLAIDLGIIQLYVGKPFGSLEDYLLAFAWGFGIETATRGFAATFTHVRGPT